MTSTNVLVSHERAQWGADEQHWVKHNQYSISNKKKLLLVVYGR